MHVDSVIGVANIRIELCEKLFLFSNANRVTFYPSNDLACGDRRHWGRYAAGGIGVSKLCVWLGRQSGGARLRSVKRLLACFVFRCSPSKAVSSMAEPLGCPVSNAICCLA